LPITSTTSGRCPFLSGHSALMILAAAGLYEEDVVSKQQERRSTSALLDGARRRMNRGGPFAVEKPGKRTILQRSRTTLWCLVTRRRGSNQSRGNDAQSADSRVHPWRPRPLPIRFPAPRMTKGCRKGSIGKKFAGAQDMQMSTTSAVLMQHKSLAHGATCNHR